MKKKVLVVDDDMAIVEVIQLMLEEEGYEVDISFDGDALVKAEKFSADILLLDIWTSGTDGRDICKQLKSQEHTKHIPIVMVSANKDTASIAEEIGADGYLTKPFEMDDLVDIVEKYILQ